MFCAFTSGPHACDRTTKDGQRLCPAHVKQLKRRGPDLLTPIGVPVEDVPPCKRCGGRDFSLKPDKRPSHKRGLYRYCLPCHRRRDLAYRARHLERRRKLDRERKKQARVRAILAEVS